MPIVNLSITLTDIEVASLQTYAQAKGITMQVLLIQVLGDFTARTADDYAAQLLTRVKSAWAAGTPAQRKALVDALVAIERP